MPTTTTPTNDPITQQAINVQTHETNALNSARTEYNYTRAITNDAAISYKAAYKAATDAGANRALATEIAHAAESEYNAQSLERKRREIASLVYTAHRHANGNPEAGRAHAYHRVRLHGATIAQATAIAWDISNDYEAHYAPSQQAIDEAASTYQRQRSAGATAEIAAHVAYSAARKAGANTYAAHHAAHAAHAAYEAEQAATVAPAEQADQNARNRAERAAYYQRETEGTATDEDREIAEADARLLRYAR